MSVRAIEALSGLSMLGRQDRSESKSIDCGSAAWGRGWYDPGLWLVPVS